VSALREERLAVAVPSLPQGAVLRLLQQTALA